MDTDEHNAGGNPAMDLHLIQGGVKILPVASYYRNWDKLRSDGPPGSYADFTLPFLNLTNLIGSAYKFEYEYPVHGQKIWSGQRL